MEIYNDENHTERNLKRKNREFHKLYIYTETEEPCFIQYDDEVDELSINAIIESRDV